MAVSRENLSYDELKDWLLKERQRLEDELKAFGDAGAEATPPGEVGYGNHPADYGTEVFEQEKELGMRRDFEEILERINAAMERMDQGTYGICQNCGRPIDPERLKALPYVEYDIECAEKLSTA
jgi:RNA polymerase-binding transcription factor DksA